MINPLDPLKGNKKRILHDSGKAKTIVQFNKAKNCPPI
jgi:hypothetical protein